MSVLILMPLKATPGEAKRESGEEVILLSQLWDNSSVIPDPSIGKSR
jgi:hypothetical protein